MRAIEQKTNCDRYGHCWCKTTWVEGKPHGVCCNCGHKQLYQSLRGESPGQPATERSSDAIAQ